MHLTHGNLRGLTTAPAAAGAGVRRRAGALEVVLDNPGGERHGVGLPVDDRPRGRPVAWRRAGPGQRADAAELARPGAAAAPAHAAGGDAFPLRPVPRLDGVAAGGHRAGLAAARSARPAAAARPAQRWPTSSRPAAAPGGNSTACAPGGAATRCARWCGRRWPAAASWSAATPRQRPPRNWCWTGRRRRRWTARPACRAWPPGCWPPSAAGHGYGLRLPGRTLPQASGEGQRRAALEALALCQPVGR
jgi:hypothetical protein